MEVRALRATAAGVMRWLMICAGIEPASEERVGNNRLAIMHGSRSESAEQVAAYLDLVPVERQPGNTVLGRARMPKAGPARVRAVLYMVACGPHTIQSAHQGTL